MQDGFFATLNQAPISKTSRTKIEKDISNLNPKARKVVFNVACAIEVVDFSDCAILGLLLIQYKCNTSCEGIKQVLVDQDCVLDSDLEAQFESKFGLDDEGSSM